MELDYPTPDSLRIRKPFPPIGRFGGKIFILAGVLGMVVLILTGPGEIPLPLLLLALIAVFAMGLFLASGEQVLDIDRATRHIVFAYRAVGRFWSLGGRQHSVSGQGGLTLRLREISSDRLSYLYYVRLNEGGTSMDLLFAYSEQEAEEIAGIISEWLGIPVENEWQPW